MSYEPEEEFYGGFDPNDPAMLQAMLDQYLMGTGETFGPGGPYGDINVPAMDPGQYQALAGLLPNTQPSGKPMTPSNYTGMLSSNRSALFDPALMGFGGMDAFAPNAFESTVTSSIKQTPELQQMYGYLRSPDSVEGLIANEIMNGGTPSTAVRKLRELLADETTDPEFKASLLMELPQRPVEYGMPAPELAVENVNWDADEGSVFAQARGIGDLYAQIPRVGPSGPQWDPATGQMISAGGQLQWGEDETGAPVMIEVTETPSPLAEKYHALGLPTPDQEYTAESFMTPDQIAMQQALGEIEDPIAQLKAAWMDPALAPSNKGAGGPAGVPAAPGWGAGAGAGAGAVAGLTDEERQAIRDWNASPAIDLAQTGQDVGNATFNTWMDRTFGPAWQNAMPNVTGNDVTNTAIAAQAGGGVAPAVGGAILDNLGGWLGGAFLDRSVSGGDEQDAVDWVRENYPEALIAEGGPPSGDVATVVGKLPAGAAGNRPRLRPLTGEEEEPPGWPRQRLPSGQVQQTGPTPREDWMRAQTLTGAGGGSGSGAMPGTPYWGAGGVGNQAMTDVMLAQIFGGGRQEPDYQRGAEEPARQPGGGEGQQRLQPGGSPPPVTINGQPNPAFQEWMQTSPTALNQQGRPDYQRGAGQAPRQPGGASYLQAVETGEGRAARRQADEQQAQILGGSTDRTGQRSHPTRTGEQARQYRAAFDAWDQATDEQRRMKQAAHNAASGRALGEAWKLQQQGVRPLDQALMARRLVLMGAGMPQGRAPGL